MPFVTATPANAWGPCVTNTPAILRGTLKAAPTSHKGRVSPFLSRGKEEPRSKPSRPSGKRAAKSPPPNVGFAQTLGRAQTAAWPSRQGHMPPRGRLWLHLAVRHGGPLAMVPPGSLRRRVSKKIKSGSGNEIKIQKIKIKTQNAEAESRT